MLRTPSIRLAFPLAFSRALSSALVLGAFAGCSSEAPVESESVGELADAPVDEVSTFSLGICLGRPVQGGSLGAPGTCGRLTSVCSATLIAPNLVLTARHCMNFPKVPTPKTLCTTPDNTFDGASVMPSVHLHVTTSPSVREGRPKWYTVKRFRFPETDNPCNDDIAVLVLDKNVPASEATPIPVDLDTELEVSQPKTMSIVGRGALLEEYDMEEGGFSAYDNGNYRRRVKTNIPVTCIPRSVGDCFATDHYTIRDAPHGFDLTPGQVVIGPAANGGDSGSGFLTHFEEGAPRVVAVMSYSGVDADGKPNQSIGIRVRPHREYLRTIAREAAVEGDYEVPAWASSRD